MHDSAEMIKLTLFISDLLIQVAKIPLRQGREYDIFSQYLEMLKQMQIQMKKFGRNET
jgi:hypothetical protein